MPFESTQYLGEVLGEPASQMRNPVNADYRCPFINGTCTKRSSTLKDSPMPVCSIFKKPNRKEKGGAPQIICVCPKRLFEAPIFEDIIKHCWPEDPNREHRVAYEIRIPKIGMVDCVIAEMDAQKNIKQFLSVEFQTIDITGSYFDAYDSHINSLVMEKAPTYNFNWMNVYKRYISQLITKGFAHSQWGTKIVAVMQDVLVERLWEIGNFKELPLDKSNIVFMSYKMVESSTEPGRFNLQLVRPIGTDHMFLMQGPLYKKLPIKEEFLKRVMGRLV